jgi:hypothetical protein
MINPSGSIPEEEPLNSSNKTNLYGLLSIQELVGGGSESRKAGAYGNREVALR